MGCDRTIESTPHSRHSSRLSHLQVALCNPALRTKGGDTTSIHQRQLVCCREEEENLGRIGGRDRYEHTQQDTVIDVGSILEVHSASEGKCTGVEEDLRRFNGKFSTYRSEHHQEGMQSDQREDKWWSVFIPKHISFTTLIRLVNDYYGPFSREYKTWWVNFVNMRTVRVLGWRIFKYKCYSRDPTFCHSDMSTLSWKWYVHRTDRSNSQASTVITSRRFSKHGAMIKSRVDFNIVEYVNVRRSEGVVSILSFKEEGGSFKPAAIFIHGGTSGATYEVLLQLVGSAKGLDLGHTADGYKSLVHNRQFAAAYNTVITYQLNDLDATHVIVKLEGDIIHLRFV